MRWPTILPAEQQAVIGVVRPELHVLTVEHLSVGAECGQGEGVKAAPLRSAATALPAPRSGLRPRSCGRATTGPHAKLTTLAHLPIPDCPASSRSRRERFASLRDGLRPPSTEPCRESPEHGSYRGKEQVRPRISHAPELHGRVRVSQTTSPLPSSGATWSRSKPSFSSTRNDGVFHTPTVDHNRFRPVAIAASSTARAASVA